MGDSAGAAQRIIAFPKGGAQKGIDEKFASDMQTVPATSPVSVALQPGRNPFNHSSILFTAPAMAMVRSACD